MARTSEEDDRAAGSQGRSDSDAKRAGDFASPSYFVFGLDL
jgi:hypothetical protein